MNISQSDFDLFLATQILAVNKDIFDDETEEKMLQIQKIDP